LRLGLEYSQELFRNFKLNISPFVDWKFFDKTVIEVEYSPGGGKHNKLTFSAGTTSIPYNFTIGINLGLEYMFRKKENTPWDLQILKPKQY
jgi:hypothetical protein